MSSLRLFPERVQAGISAFINKILAASSRVNDTK